MIGRNVARRTPVFRRLLLDRAMLVTTLAAAAWMTAVGHASAPVAQPPAAALSAPQPTQPPPPPPPAPVKEPGKPRPAASPKPAPPPAPAEPIGQPVNIRVELTITDQRGSSQPAKKTVSVIAADRSSGLVRSESFVPGIGPVQLHVDAEPRIMIDGTIRLRFGLQYDSPGETGAHGTDPGASGSGVAGGPPSQPDLIIATRGLTTQIKENLALVLENGKPVLATQSADPVNDRQVTVEVKATIMR